MSSLTGAIGNIAGQGVGLTKSVGLLSELTGQPGRVQLVQPGFGTILQFDACINEMHGREAAVTTNPIEDGSVVSDHIVVQPLGVTLTGVVSDTPLYDAQRFLRQTLGNAASSLASPLGVVSAAASLTAFQLSHPQNSLPSPSKEAYATLMKLAAGDPSASPPTLPQPFSVLTTYARYGNMLIKSLQFPRDASTSGVCVFTLVMEQIQLVTPQFVNIAVVSEKALAASLKQRGEQQAADLAELNGYTPGRALGVSTTQGALGAPANVVSKLKSVLPGGG